MGRAGGRGEKAGGGGQRDGGRDGEPPKCLQNRRDTIATHRGRLPGDRLCLGVQRDREDRLAVGVHHPGIVGSCQPRQPRPGEAEEEQHESHRSDH